MPCVLFCFVCCALFCAAGFVVVVASVVSASIMLVVYGSLSSRRWYPCIASVGIACLMKLLCVWLGSSCAASILDVSNGVVWLFVLRCTSISLARPCSCVHTSDWCPCPSMCCGRNIRCFGCLLVCSIWLVDMVFHFICCGVGCVVASCV